MNIRKIPRKLTPAKLRQLLGMQGGWIHVPEFTHALTLLMVSYEGHNPELRTTVDCDRVASRNWMPERFASVMEAHRGGLVLPPIEVVCMMWQGEAFYSLTDGNHRTEGAKAVGQRTIEAIVSEVGVCDENAFYIRGLRLYTHSGEDKGLVNFTTARMMRGLGVRHDWCGLRWMVDWWCLAKQRRAMRVTAAELVDADNLWE